MGPSAVAIQIRNQPDLHSLRRVSSSEALTLSVLLDRESVSVIGASKDDILCFQHCFRMKELSYMLLTLDSHSEQGGYQVRNLGWQKKHDCLSQWGGMIQISSWLGFLLCFYCGFVLAQSICSGTRADSMELVKRKAWCATSNGSCYKALEWARALRSSFTSGLVRELRMSLFRAATLKGAK